MSSTRRHPARRAVRAIGAWGMVGLGLLPALGASRPRPAAADGSFSGIAAADGVQIGVTSKGFLIVEGGAAGLPSSQAAVDSLGQSVAYAAFPYPTDAALTVPGLIASAGGPALPRYPLIAQSSQPTTPSATVDAGPAHLQADSAERSSHGQAIAPQGGAPDGTAIGRTATDAFVVADPAGPVTSTAASTVEAFSAAAGTLRVGRVHSEATVVRGPGGEPKVTSGLEVAQVTVAGQTVGFGEGGLVFPGGPAAAPANPLAAALADAGVTVQYLAPVRTPDGAGIVSAGIEVRIVRQVTGTGPTTVSYVLGRSFAYVGAVTAPAVHDAGSGAVGEPGDGGVAPGAASSGNSAVASPAAPLPVPVGPVSAGLVASGPGSSSGLGSSSARLGSSSGFGSSSSVSGPSSGNGSGSDPSASSGGSLSGEVAGSPSGSSAADAGLSFHHQSAAVPAVHNRSAYGFDVGGSYLVIVLAALATAGGAQLLRILGVKLA